MPWVSTEIVSFFLGHLGRLFSRYSFSLGTGPQLLLSGHVAGDLLIIVNGLKTCDFFYLIVVV